MVYVFSLFFPTVVTLEFSCIFDKDFYLSFVTLNAYVIDRRMLWQKTKEKNVPKYSGWKQTNVHFARIHCKDSCLRIYIENTRTHLQIMCRTTETKGRVLRAQNDEKREEKKKRAHTNRVYNWPNGFASRCYDSFAFALTANDDSTNIRCCSEDFTLLALRRKRSETEIDQNAIRIQSEFVWMKKNCFDDRVENVSLLFHHLSDAQIVTKTNFSRSSTSWNEIEAQIDVRRGEMYQKQSEKNNDEIKTDAFSFNSKVYTFFIRFNKRA